MKTKKTNIIILISVLLILVAVVLFMAISYLFPYRYVENCFYSNREDFEKIPYYLESLYDEGKKHMEIEIDENSDCDEITAILLKLNKQYQNDSKHSVFRSVGVRYDNDGDLMFYMAVQKEKLKNRDGVNGADIRCCYIVYVDENYDGSSPAKYREPFCDNWYTWSSDTYSG